VVSKKHLLTEKCRSAARIFSGEGSINCGRSRFTSATNENAIGSASSVNAWHHRKTPQDFKVLVIDSNDDLLDALMLAQQRLDKSQCHCCSEAGPLDYRTCEPALPPRSLSSLRSLDRGAA